MPDIPASDPVVIPEVVIPEKTFDKWVVPEISFRWYGPDQPLIGDITFRIARRVTVTDPETEVESSFMEWGDKTVSMRVDNIWELAAADPEIAGALEILMEAITKVGSQNGIL